MSALTHCPAHTSTESDCLACRARHAEWARTRYKMIAYGRWEGLVAASPIRARIKSLQKAGISQRAIARGAGVSQTTVDRIACGKQKRLRSTTAGKLMAFDPSALPEVLVSGLGVSRRLRALMAAGWDSVTLAQPLGVTSLQVRKWRRNTTASVRNRVHRAVAELFREIGDRAGPNLLAAAHARRLGYAPPICWDDDGDLDNPQSRPKGRVIAHMTAPTSRKAA